MHPDEFEPFKHKVNFRLHAAGMPHGHTSYRLSDYDNDVLLELAKDKSARVRRVLARNSRAPIAALELLAKSQDRDTLRNLVSNRKTPTDLIRRVIKSLMDLESPSEGFVTFVIAIRNPRCPADVIKLFDYRVNFWNRQDMHRHFEYSPNGAYHNILQQKIS